MEKQIIKQLKKYTIKCYKECFIVELYLEGKKIQNWMKETAHLQAISEPVDLLWIQQR